MCVVLIITILRDSIDRSLELHLFCILLKYSVVLKNFIEGLIPRLSPFVKVSNRSQKNRCNYITLSHNKIEQGSEIQMSI